MSRFFMKFYLLFGICFITKPSSSSWVLLFLTVNILFCYRSNFGSLRPIGDGYTRVEGGRNVTISVIKITNLG